MHFSRLAVLLAVVLPSGAAIVQPSAPVPHPPGYVCVRAGRAITIDGALDDAAWEAAPWTRRLRRHGDRSVAGARAAHAHEDAVGRHQSLHRRRHPGPHLWAEMTTHDSPLYQENAFEFFIDPDGDNHELLRVRDQRPQHDVGSVPAAAVPRRRPGPERLGDPRTEVRRAPRRHVERFVRRRSRLDDRDRRSVDRARRAGAPSVAAARRRSVAHELHARRDPASREEGGLPEDRGRPSQVFSWARST